MLRSLYIASTGMMAQRKRMDVLTNNITNIETVGYKKDTLLTRSFADMLIERMGDPDGNSSSIGALNTGVHIDEIVTRHSQGGLEETGRLSDVALVGDGFFVISTPNGERYSRNGAFAVSQNGYLINEDGYYVQGTGGRIYLGSGAFSIDEQGNVTADGAATNRLRIVTFTDAGALRKQGSNLYAGNGAIPSTNTQVRQGSLENSNVDMAEEMVNMMTVSRSYETNQRMIQMLDSTLEKSVNEVGRV